jgi:hypothetical protein
VLESGTELNENVLDFPALPSFDGALVAVEMVASYGMPVGREVFETVLFTGRLVERADAWRHPTQLVYRKDVKLYLCQSARAKDANIKQALIDLLGPVGTKAQPGPLYGVKGHTWSALAVAAYADAHPENVEPVADRAGNGGLLLTPKRTT